MVWMRESGLVGSLVPCKLRLAMRDDVGCVEEWMVWCKGLE